MPLSCFGNCPGKTLRKIHDALGRRISATEMVEERGIHPALRYDSAASYRDSEKSDQSYAVEGPLASPNVIPIAYDEEYYAPQKKKSRHYRSSPDDTVSVLITDDEEVDTHFDVPTHPNVAIRGSRRPSFDRRSLNEAVQQHDIPSDSFPFGSGPTNISSPLAQHHLFAPKQKQEAKHIPSSPPNLERKLSHLNTERDLLADYLETAYNDLARVRSQLRLANQTLTQKDQNINDLHTQATNLKKGMNIAMHQHSAMAHELTTLKALHKNCHIPPRRSLFCDFFCTSTRSRLRELEKIIRRADSDIRVIQASWAETHRKLRRTELVLGEQRRYMKSKIEVLRDTQDELSAVKQKLGNMGNVLKDRDIAIDVLRRNNRDLGLQIGYLRRERNGQRGDVRNFTV